MKNTKFTKIALLALSAVLLIGAAVGFSASAEDAEPQYKIIARNVVYGETVPVVYAVNVEVGSADAANVKVAYYYEKDGKESWKNATALDLSDPKNICEKDGKKYITFATDGVVPKKLGDVIFATVYTGVAPADDAVWVEYSAAEYFYNRLYEDGFVNMPETDVDNYNKKLLYEAQIEYSTRAQLVLGYEEGETLVNAYNYAYTTDEYVKINGGKSAFDVDTVTATYDGTGTFEAWVVDGVEVDSNVITVRGVTLIDVKLGVHTCVDENPADHKCDTCSGTIGTGECTTADNNHLCDVCGKIVSECADGNADGKCDTCGAYTFDSAVSTTSNILIRNWSISSGSKEQQTLSGIDATTERQYTYGAFMSLATDPADSTRNVLKVAITTTGSATPYQSHILMTPDVKDENGNFVVYEFDYKFSDPSVNTYTTNVNFLVGNADTANYTSGSDYTYYTAVYKATGLSGDSLLRGGNAPTGSGLFSFDQWVKLRLVYSIDKNSFETYMSYDEGATWMYCNTKECIGSLNGNATQFGIRFTVYNGTSNQYVDNMSCVKVSSVNMKNSSGGDAYVYSAD